MNSEALSEGEGLTKKKARKSPTMEASPRIMTMLARPRSRMFGYLTLRAGGLAPGKENWSPRREANPLPLPDAANTQGASGPVLAPAASFSYNGGQSHESLLARRAVIAHPLGLCGRRTCRSILGNRRDIPLFFRQLGEMGCNDHVE